MELVLKLKNNASKLLLAIMESRHDSENAERIMINMSPQQVKRGSDRKKRRERGGEREGGREGGREERGREG